MSSQMTKWLLVITCCTITSGCVVELRKQEATVDDVDGADGGASDGETTAGNGELPIGGCLDVPDCKTVGVCAALKPVCVDGSWICPDYATELADQGYADEESLAEHCDGKDNDCDGEVDEVVEEASSECPGVGVCSAGVPRRCIDKTMVCWFKDVENYEIDEKSCDSLDNDCDDDVDEAFGHPGDYCTEFQVVGECANSLVTCEDGEWKCTPQGFYEPGIETTCDGLDNDCDGTADEDLTKLTASTCHKVGVCSLPGAQDTIATCINGAWECNYDNVEYYEDTEQLCDGLDNDCDGDIDESVVTNTVQCDEASKAKLSEGECAKTNPENVAKCVGGEVQCFFSSDSIPFFENTEISCDGKDNDCDGEVDESTVQAPPGACDTKGVCQLNSAAYCSPDGWKCTYGSVDYEEIESTCDGLDNDCDGEVDENSLVAPGDCPRFGIGVCNDPKVKVTCDSLSGNASCDFSEIEGFETIELSCDGEDNDCDGKIDEDLSDVSQSTCSTLGICGGSNSVKIVAQCINSAWDCKFQNVPGFEETEITCDGKDNDCDGFIDEGIEDPTGGGCPTSGVCADTIKASCNNSGWICDFSQVLGFENPEISCDGKDNDCDGTIDEDACPDLYPCTSNEQCVSGICKEAPDLESTYCVGTNTQCPNQAGTQQVASGASDCAELDAGGGTTEWYVTTCQSGGWVTAASPCDSNACVDGSCTDCLPGKTACESGLYLITCKPDGTIDSPSQCPVPSTCIDGGLGVCLGHSDHQVNSGTTHSTTAALAFAPDGTGIIAWETQLNENPTQIALHRFSELALYPGNFKAFNADPFAFLTVQNSPTLDFINNTLGAIAWSGTTSETSSDIQVRLFDITSSGKTIKPTTTANVQTDFQRTAPRMVARVMGNGGVTVVWQAQTATGGNGLDIMTRTFDLEFVNDFVLTPTQSEETFVYDDTSNDQTNPAIARLKDHSMIVAWEDNTTDINTWGVFGWKMDKNGVPTGNVFQLNTTASGDQTQVAVDALDKGFVAVWTSTQEDSGDIMIGLFNDDGSKVQNKSEHFVTNAQTNLSLAGVQHRADVAAFAGNRIVVVYEDTVTEGTGSGIYMQEFSSELEAVGQARNVNQTVKPGNQMWPSVRASDSVEKPWVIIAYEDEVSNSIFTRPMELSNL